MIDRTVQLSSAQAIFFPIVTAVEWRNFAGSDTCSSPAALLSAARIEDIYATLNGVALAPDLSAYRQSCEGQPDIPPAADPAIDGAFRIDSPAGSYLASLGQTGVDLYASDGFWLMLEPLAPGTYDLAFGGTFTFNPESQEPFRFGQDNTYRLVVTADVPGPGREHGDPARGPQGARQEGCASGRQLAHAGPGALRDLASFDGLRFHLC